MAKLYIFVIVSILSFDRSISQDDVRKPPNIIMPRVRMDLYYLPNTNVVVNCSADGMPTPTYSWAQNGTVIAPGQYISFDPAAGTLTIPTFSTREEATYVCTASNTFNNGVTRVVSFAAPVRLWVTRIEKFDSEELQHTVPEHQYLRLLCNKKRVVGATITFNWYSDQSTSISLDNNRLFIDQEGDLHFTYITPSDAIISYSCGISVDQNKQIILGTKNSLIVTSNANLSPIKPYLQYSNSGIKGMRFSTAKLECMFSGYDPNSPYIPNISWRDDSGKPIVNTQNPKYSVSADGRTLTITNLQEEDEKSYTCTARNSAGEASGPVFLNVTSGPIFINGAPLDQTVSQYTDATFNCDTRSASGENPPSQPVWSINGQKLGPQINSKFVLSDDNKILTVKNVSKATDIMCVQCEVSNDVDTVLSNACLNVLLPIKIEKEPPLVQRINYGDNVDLTVTASTDPAMTLSYRWEFNNITYVGSDHPPGMYYNPSNNLAYINTSSLTQDQYGEIGGPYRRVIYHLYDTKVVEINVILLDRQVITTPATITFDPITNTTEASKTVRQDFECHLNYMHVFIPVELVPNSQLTLRELNCRLLNNGTHHKISFDYDECGTSQSFFEDYISIDNEVNVHNILNNTAEITFVEDYTIPLKCLVDRSKHVNGAIQVISRESIHENAVQSTDFHMKEFTTKDYDLEITAYPIQLPINREIFFEVALTNSSSNSTGIFVEKCEATPSIHRNGTVRVSLIHFGCSVNPAVKVLPVPEIDRFRFSIQAFHFSGPENVDNMVYVHCSASTCGGVMCDNTCPKSSRRRRRSTRGQASATLTSGSHVVG